MTTPFQQAAQAAARELASDSAHIPLIDSIILKHFAPLEDRRGQRIRRQQPETMKRKGTIRKSRKVGAEKRKPDSLHRRVRRPDRELELYEMRRYMI